MRVLVLGSAAREHALAARLSDERGADAVMCASGNPGTAAFCWTFDADFLDPASLPELAAREQVDLTVWKASLQ